MNGFSHVLGIAVLALLCLQVSCLGTNCTLMPNDPGVTSIGISAYYCNLPSPITGLVQQIGYSNKTTRWYFTAGTTFYSSPVAPHLISTSTVLNSYNINPSQNDFQGYPGLTMFNIFLINYFNNPPNPDVDEIVYTMADPNQVNVLVVMSASSSQVELISNASLLVSPADQNYVYAGTLLGNVGDFDPTFNISWFFFTPPLSYGSLTPLLSHYIGWLNMATYQTSIYPLSQGGILCPIPTDAVAVQFRQTIYWLNNSMINFTPLSNNPFSSVGFQPSLIATSPPLLFAPLALFYLDAFDTMLIGCRAGLTIEMDLDTWAVKRAFLVGYLDNIGNSISADIMKMEYDPKDNNYLNVYGLGRSLDNALASAARLAIADGSSVGTWFEDISTSLATGYLPFGSSSYVDNYFEIALHPLGKALPVEPQICPSGPTVFYDQAHTSVYFTATSQILLRVSHNCSFFETCDECSQDPLYCGWCATSQTCVDSASLCSGTSDSFSMPAQCPLSSVVSPMQVAAVGGSNITVFTSYLANTTYSAQFSESGTVFSTKTMLSLNQASVTFAVPAAPLGTSPTSPIKLQLVAYSIPWGDPFTFYYINCSSFSSCSSCASASSGVCGWCPTSASCSDATTCPALSNSCPAILSISPSSISAFGGQTVSIVTNGTLSGSSNYFVTFGNSSPIQATLQPVSKRYSLTSTSSSSSTLTVTAPSLSGLPGLSSITISILGPSGLVISSSSSSLQAYDCSKFSTCSSCFSAGSQCAWCTNSLTCLDSSSGAFASCTAGSPSSCPSISAVSPNITLSGSSTTLTITGSGLQFLPSSGVSCIFTSPSSNTTTPFSATSSTCSGLPSPVAIYSLSLGITSASTQSLTNAIEYEVYDCAPQPCGSCVSPGKASNCQFCSDSTLQWGCQVTGTSCGVAITSQSNCPTLSSVSPSYVLLNSSPQLTLSGQLLSNLPASGMTCVFTSPDGTQNFGNTTESTSGGKQICNALSLPSSQSVNVTLFRNDIAWTNSFNLEYFVCGSATTFDQCSVFGSQCAWCPNGCQPYSSSCPGVSVAPSLSYVTPNLAWRIGGDSVTVFGGSFGTAGTSYGCLFGNLQSAGTAVSPNSIQCTVPPSAASGHIQLSIMDTSFSIYYANNSLDFTFIDCPVFSSSSCSDACTAAPINGEAVYGCGFCLGTGACTTQARCASIWFPQCLHSSSIEPHFALLDGNTQIFFPLQQAPQTPSGVPVHASDFTCHFGSTATSPATLTYSGEATGNSSALPGSLTCLAPAVAAPIVSSYQVFYKSASVSDSTTFPFMNCPIAQDCSSCLAMAPCGWCLNSQSCGIPADCTGGNYTNTVCPSISSLQPSTGSTSGGTKVNVNGNLFIQDSNLAVKFGNQVVTTTYIDSNTLQFMTPHHSSGSVAVTLVWQQSGADYSVGSIQFTYVSKINVVGIAVGVSVGAAFLLAIVITVAYIIYRRKTKGILVFNVKEPDYVLVAFGPVGELLYKMPSDQYGLLEQVLCRYNFGLQAAIASVAPATEEDSVAKSMLYVAQAHKLSVGMINALVANEISRCLEENTIFRNNSVASKTFKFFSRVVGIPYLWNCMARVISELETLGVRADKEKEKNQDQNRTSLLSVSMEVDMNRMDEGSPDAAGSNVDAEVNSLQLKLTCQKLFSVLVKNGVNDIPTEFRKIFVEIDTQIMKKFNSDGAVYKAIGGFFFLRFVCPSITAPHYYGLLERPPNETTQRQLVLISKVIQSLANMQLPGRKEAYMLSMSDFIEKNIGTVIRFYQDMRETSKMNSGQVIDMDVPDVIRQNSLAQLWEFIHTFQTKLLDDIQQKGDEQFKDMIIKDLQTMLNTYPNKPKKANMGGDDPKPKSSKKAHSGSSSKKRATNAQ